MRVARVAMPEGLAVHERVAGSAALATVAGSAVLVVLAALAAWPCR